MRIASIVGARPQFIKLAPLVRILSHAEKSGKGLSLQHLIIHTGQHYDYLMDKVFFCQLGLPDPTFNLEVGSGSHVHQLSEMMKKLDPVLTQLRPDVVIVYGDTNSTLAGALVASKHNFPTVHVEAGLRSFNRYMPEEINRILTDHCTDILLVPTDRALHNLRNEGISNTLPDKGVLPRSYHWNSQHHVTYPIGINTGDIMYDAVLLALQRVENESNLCKKLGLVPKGYYLATLHRAENTDDSERLQSIWEALDVLSARMPVIFPLHPRTKKALSRIDLKNTGKSIRIIDPVGYFDMLSLQKGAYKILTDSGGMQKEAYYLKVPCITMRDETEWMETIHAGCNILAGAEKKKILDFAGDGFEPSINCFSHNLFGDGNTAERIYEILTHMI